MSWVVLSSLLLLIFSLFLWLVTVWLWCARYRSLAYATWDLLGFLDNKLLLRYISRDSSFKQFFSAPNMPANVANRATVPPHMSSSKLSLQPTPLSTEWAPSHPSQPALARQSPPPCEQSWAEGMKAASGEVAQIVTILTPHFSSFLCITLLRLLRACSPFPDAGIIDSGEGGRAGQSILSCFIAIFGGERIWQSLFTQSLLEAAFQSWLILKIKHTHWKTMSEKMPEMKRGTEETEKPLPAASSPVSTCSKSPKVGFF